MGASDLPIAELDLNVSRWGNSLAVRLPVALARELGLAEGDVLHVQAGEAGVWQMSARRKRAKLSQQEWIARARKHLQTMPRTESVIEEVRSSARY